MSEGSLTVLTYTWDFVFEGQLAPWPVERCLREPPQPVNVHTLAEVAGTGTWEVRDKSGRVVRRQEDGKNVVKTWRYVGEPGWTELHAMGFGWDAKGGPEDRIIYRDGKFELVLMDHDCGRMRKEVDDPDGFIENLNESSEWEGV